jgi:hypothetical protein
MKSGVRVIKRGREDGTRNLPPEREEKTVRQSEREIVGTVKGWIAEWEQQRRLDTQSALALIKLGSAGRNVSFLPG